MGDSPSRVYGRIRALEVDSHISFLVPENQQEKYKQRFLRQLQKYSFRRHHRGEPKHEGCRFWLEGITERNFRNPEEYATVIMGDMDRMQQKDHAERFYMAFIENL